MNRRTPFVCPHCKNPVGDDDALLCLYCGESLGRSVGVMGALRHPRSKWIFLSIVLLVILSFLLLSSCAWPAGQAAGQAAVVQVRPPKGEKLTYAIRWLGLPIGSIATFSRGIRDRGGREVYVFEADVRIGGLVALFFGTTVHFVSYVDAGTFTCVRAEETRRGHGDKQIVMDFDPVKKRVIVRDLRNKTETSIDVPAGIHDILSSCYLLRLKPLRTGDRIAYDMFHGGSVRPYVFWVGEKTASGEFRVHPYALKTKEGIERGRVDAIFADDAGRTPRRGIVRGPVFGHVTITLVKAEKAAS